MLTLAAVQAFRKVSDSEPPCFPPINDKRPGSENFSIHTHRFPEEYNSVFKFKYSFILGALFVTWVLILIYLSILILVNIILFLIWITISNTDMSTTMLQVSWDTGPRCLLHMEVGEVFSESLIGHNCHKTQSKFYKYFEEGICLS